jgi:hypothetical protein
MSKVCFKIYYNKHQTDDTDKQESVYNNLPLKWTHHTISDETLTVTHNDGNLELKNIIHCNTFEAT